MRTLQAYSDGPKEDIIQGISTLKLKVLRIDPNQVHNQIFSNNKIAGLVGGWMKAELTPEMCRIIAEVLQS